MSDHQFTGPELAALSFRILGVVILLSGISQSLFLLFGAVQADWSTWNLFGLLATVVFVGVVALPLVFHSESLVAWLFPKSEPLRDLDRRSREDRRRTDRRGIECLSTRTAEAAGTGAIRSLGEAKGLVVGIDDLLVRARERAG